jgi:RNA polymerase sigma-70 factor (ECF subfamily)
MGATQTKLKQSANSAKVPTAPTALDALLRGKRKFLAFVEKRVGSRAAAEDILQDAFVRSLERAEQLQELETGERATAWFYRVLRNAVVDYYRHRDVEQRGNQSWAQEWEHAAELAEKFGDSEHHEVCGCFREFVHLLKPEYTRAIEAVELRGKPLKDFAAAEKISLNNAAVRVHRARAALRQHIQRACTVCAEHGCLDCHCKASS